MFNSSRQTTKIPRSELDSLLAFYQLRQEKDVFEYLELHPHLLFVLEKGKEFIYHIFPSQNFFLELATEPENGDSQLVIYIKRHLEDVEQALDLMENLYDEWLGKYNAEVRSQIYIRYDYQ